MMGCIVLSVFFFAILRVVAGKLSQVLLQRLIIFVSFKSGFFCILLLTSSANVGESFFSAKSLWSRDHGSGLVVRSIGSISRDPRFDSCNHQTISRELVVIIFFWCQHTQKIMEDKTT